MEDNFEGEENQGKNNEKEELFKIFDKNKDKNKEKKENDINKKFEEKEKQEKENKIQELKENLTEKKPEEKEEEDEENLEESDHEQEQEKKENDKEEKKEEKIEEKIESIKLEEKKEKEVIEKEKKEEKKEEEKKEEKKEAEEKKKISEYELINQDPSLKPYEWCIKRRNDHFKKTLHEIESNEKSLIDFAKSYETMGVHVLPNGDIKYREYAPGCKGVSLFGEFNNWNKEEFWAIKNPFGCWELIIKSDNGKNINKK